MPIRITNCGDETANGIYYQSNLNPPRFVKDDQTHEIRGQCHYLNTGSYGSSYSSKVYVISKVNACHQKGRTLYVSRLCAFNVLPSSPDLRWSVVTGAHPTPNLEQINFAQQQQQRCPSNNQMFQFENNCNQMRSNMSRKRTFGMYCDDGSEDLTDSRSCTMDMDEDCSGGIDFPSNCPPVKRKRLNPIRSKEKHLNEPFDWNVNYMNMNQQSNQNQFNQNNLHFSSYNGTKFQ